MSPRSEGIVDVAGLERALSHRTDAEVRFDKGSRSLYATDASNYRQLPIGVVVPRTVDSIAGIVSICREFGAPILPRGCGTSLAGQTCNVAVVLDTSKHLRRIVSLDAERRLATVEPGVVLDQLRKEADKFGLTFPPDPSTHEYNTLGGMLGNNSCGVHSLLAAPDSYGRTSDLVEELEILTYEGDHLTVGATSEEVYGRRIEEGGRTAEIYRALRGLVDRHANAIRQRFPDIPRRISGYNLPDLLPENGFHLARALVGTEGTCVVILRAVLRLVPNPPQRSLAVLAYPDIFLAADDVPRILEFHPIGLEAIDHHLVENMRAKHVHPREVELLPQGKAWLLVEFGAGTVEAAAGQAERMVKEIASEARSVHSSIVSDRDQQKQFWSVREAGLAVTAQEPDGRRGWPGWEDSAVGPGVLGAYLRDLQTLWDRYQVVGQLYGHFGQGCVHSRTTFDLETGTGIDRFRAFMQEAGELVVRHGGSLSGEHGDGQARAELLAVMFGEEIVGAFREFKRIWDPQGKMNPGKVVDPDGMTDHLRLKETYRPRAWTTAFSFPEDHGDFNSVTLRCVGIGKCRRTDDGLMCPSYQATLEEKFTTRGRARLLYEMAQHGGLHDEGWRSSAVRESLDLCLSCKGCKGECPVNVDMAAYKAEFLSHYYRGRPRPRPAYALGLSHRWLPIGAKVPGIVNALSHWGPTAGLMKSIAGIAPERHLPALAKAPFDRSFRRREGADRALSQRTVLLWPDTWNNFLHPEILEAAEEVLRRLGLDVILPPRTICCGRPLYDFGMLTRAKKQVRQIVTMLSREIEWGTPVVVLEPSCLSVFRDELPSLLPKDPRATQLKHDALSLPELIQKNGLPIPQWTRRALVQPHCHESAVIGLDAFRHLLREMGMDVRMLEGGCCGMAGSFGMEAKKYPVSIKIAERVVAPAIRQRDEGTVVVADGFSCREQIRDLAGTYPLHVAQVLRMAMSTRS
ncbi:MAG: FAD-binding and (Fe-S)-binding domain-containing protein [Thermoplasmata archaeon]